MIELIYEKEFMLTKQMHQKNVTFVIIGYKYEPYLRNGCFALMQKSYEF